MPPKPDLSEIRAGLPHVNECTSMADMVNLTHLAITGELPTPDQTEQTLLRLVPKYGDGILDTLGTGTP